VAGQTAGLIEKFENFEGFVADKSRKPEIRTRFCAQGYFFQIGCSYLQLARMIPDLRQGILKIDKGDNRVRCSSILAFNFGTEIFDRKRVTK
jgi:hypothetical protein